MATPEVGTVLRSRYVLQDPLGKNATRQTWLAKDREENCKVVVKMLAFNLQLQWQEVKLFEREAQALQQLDHPRIPEYLDYFTVEGQPSWMVLVQSYVPGESLQALLDKGEQFDEERLKQIARDVLVVLTYLHDRKPPLLHRDIKPSILIMGEGHQTYLVDFGAAQRQPTQVGTFTVVGTYGYTPMEQFGGRAVPASDLYALGATLVHLATGVPPADLPLKERVMDFREQAGLSPEFSDWLEKTIEPLVGDRASSAKVALAILPHQPEANKKSSVVRKNRDKKPIFREKRDERISIVPYTPKSTSLLFTDISDYDDKSWLFVDLIFGSTIRYQKFRAGIEIQFKAYPFNESRMCQRNMPNRYWNYSKTSGGISLLLTLFLCLIGGLTSSGLPVVILILSLSVSLSLLFRALSYHSEYLPNTPEIAFIVRNKEITVWEIQGAEYELILSELLDEIQSIKLYRRLSINEEGKGLQVFAEVNRKNEKSQDVKIEASLSNPELSWIQNNIDSWI